MRRIGLWAAVAALVYFGLVPSVLAFGRGGGGRGGGARGGAVAGGRAGGGHAAAGRRSAAAVGPYGGAAAGSRSRGTVVGPGGGHATGASRSAAAVGPRGGSAVGTRSAGRAVGPAGGSAGYRSGSRTVTTPRGGTIEAGGAAGGRTGPGGGAAGRAVGGVQVTTPGGRTATRVGAGGAAVGPGGRAVGGRTSVSAASGPRGTAAGVAHRGTAIGPGGAVSGGYRGGVAVGPGGAVARGYRGGAAVGPYGAAAGVSRGVVGVGAGGAVAARRGTYYASGAALRAQGAYVRNGFGYYNAFTPGWYGRYPGAWRAARWAAATAWVPATWAAVSSYCSYPETPAYYDYGTSVVYEGDTVYMDGEPVATAEQYAQQATELSTAGREAQPPENEEWQPLGVFALVRGEEQTSDKIFQLAINKDGVIRGNYYDAFSDNTHAVYGSVDRRTQRAAWSIGYRQDVVFEAGIANFTRDETPILVHYGTGDTQQLTLVRVEQPSGQQGR